VVDLSEVASALAISTQAFVVVSLRLPHWHDLLICLVHQLMWHRWDHLLHLDLLGLVHAEVEHRHLLLQLKQLKLRLSWVDQGLRHLLLLECFRLFQWHLRPNLLRLESDHLLLDRHRGLL